MDKGTFFYFNIHNSLKVIKTNLEAMITLLKTCKVFFCMCLIIYKATHVCQVVSMVKETPQSHFSCRFQILRYIF